MNGWPKACLDCGRPMRAKKTSGPGPAHAGRGLCGGCYSTARRNGTRVDFERTLRSRDELMDDWVVLRGRGMTQREAAQHLGMTYAAFRKGYERARAAGDPRAVVRNGAPRGTRRAA